MFDTIANHRVPNMKTTTRTDIQGIKVVVQSHDPSPSLAMKSINTRTKKERPKITKRTFAELSHAKDSTPSSSRLYEGRLIVNGFHPQLTKVNTNYCPSKELLNALPRVSNNSHTLDERISNTVNNCRLNEQTEMRKRQKVSPLDLIPPRHHRQNDQDSTTQKLIAADLSVRSSFNDSFKESSAPQFIADIGGRGVSCNSEFLRICGASLQEPSTSFTLFNLIVPSLRFKLFEILSMAVGAVGDDVSTRPSPLNSKDNNLRQFPDATNNSPHSNAVSSMLHSEPNPSACLRTDDEEIMHMSITLPCIQLPASKTSHNITIIFMNNEKLENRCFLSILSPVLPIISKTLNDRPPGSNVSSIGEIQFVRQNDLLRLLTAR